MRVAVYSGSFNPLHIGHLAIMKKLCSSGYDKVYLVVSPKNPLKDTISADSGRDRFNAAQAAISRHPELEGKVIADDIELGMPSPQYTVRTLQALKEREPQNRFTLVMGGDNLAGLRRWREWERILWEFGVTVYPREGYDIGDIRSSLMSEWAAKAPGTALEEHPYLIEILDAPMVDISSTEIREGLTSGRDMSRYLM